MTSLVDAIIEKYGPGEDESFDFIAVPRRRLESTSSENGKCPVILKKAEATSVYFGNYSSKYFHRQSQNFNIY